ncbi:hypothetical protein P692DRAFT_20838071 [Suillus brevipes Sb2]|nr:hypothetical protein P692DRAFT_20838071 [Suillus brevipes Sb2]
MRLSSAIVLAVVAALASSSFATATDDGVGSSSSNGKCDLFCVIHDQCKGCMAAMVFHVLLSCESCFCFYIDVV